jgi:hypothetical protein
MNRVNTIVTMTVFLPSQTGSRSGLPYFPVFAVMLTPDT